MPGESERYLELLEKRLSLLELLTQTLDKARGDLVAMDLESIRAGIREQERLCKAIRTLDQEITASQALAARLAGAPLAVAEISWPALNDLEEGQRQRVQKTLQRLAHTQREVRRRNDAHQALLRRSGRTVGVLLNLLQSHAPTYGMEPGVESGTLCEERV